MKNVQVMVRTSERTLYTRCHQAWWWSYVEQRTPLEKWSRALIFGDMVHRSLAAYYIPETRKARKRGPHPAQTFVKLYDIMNADGKAFSVRVDDEFWIDALDLGVEMMENYVTHWRDADKDILVLYPEMPFQYPIIDPVTGKHLVTYVGTTDALIRRISTGKLGLFEHKTAAAINTNHLFLDEQASSYWCIVPLWLLANGIIKEKDNMDFMLYNFMRKAEKDDRPQNALGQYLNINGTVSKRQPPPLFHREPLYRGKHEQANTMARIIAQVHEMNMIRNGTLTMYKSPSKDCSFCEWADLCELHETGSDWKELKRMTSEKWEPYLQHIWALQL